jgi:hypothetical protein
MALLKLLCWCMIEILIKSRFGIRLLKYHVQVVYETVVPGSFFMAKPAVYMPVAEGTLYFICVYNDGPVFFARFLSIITQPLWAAQQQRKREKAINYSIRRQCETKNL